MTQKEREVLQAVLDTFDHWEDKCYEKMAFMEEHNLSYEKQAIEIRRQAYHKCFRELQKTLVRMDEDKEPMGFIETIRDELKAGGDLEAILDKYVQCSAPELRETMFYQVRRLVAEQDLAEKTK